VTYSPERVITRGKKDSKRDYRREPKRDSKGSLGIRSIGKASNSAEHQIIREGHGAFGRGRRKEGPGEPKGTVSQANEWNRGFLMKGIS